VVVRRLGDAVGDANRHALGELGDRRSPL